MRIFEFVMENADAFAVFALIFVAIMALGAIVCLILSMRWLRVALGELRKARLEIQSHPAIPASHRVPYEERLKKEYEKRGLKWEGK